MISVAGMRELEKRAAGAGIGEELLMENAGASAARIVDSEAGLRGKAVTIFCGTGNNAGDGLVFARHAAERGASVRVYFVSGTGTLRPLPKKHSDALRGTGAKFIDHPEDADILVDAMLGTGIRGEVSGEYRKAIEKFNSMKGFKVSLDCPSGIDCDTGKVMGASVKPDMTITFHDVKNGMTRANSGKIAVADIGIPAP
jgi:hydroxyethylthiazole kinase-like uncharacterized protein yjeF